MAGGIGSRFWPLSRTEKPKQFVDILNTGRTFIQMTYDRFASFIPAGNFLVVTGERYKNLVMEQLPELNEDQVLLEPGRRNTAPCIAYAAYKLKKKNPDAVMVVAPADHLILNVPVFTEVIGECLQYAARHDSLLTIGITPSFPSTGYGYIETEGSGEGVARVVSFREKPDLDTACGFIESGRYRWNSGMFIWSVRTIVAAMERHLPDIAEAFDALSEQYYTPEEQTEVNKIYKECRSISIDYGVLEKASNVAVYGADFGWSDLGTWTSLYEQSTKDEDGNMFAGENIVATDSRNCLVKELNAGKQVVIDGMDNLLVVDTDDALLICRRGDEARVKSVIEQATQDQGKG